MKTLVPTLSRKRRKVVAVAKDVLKQINSLKVKTGNGYVVPNNLVIPGVDCDKDDLQKHVDTVQKKCTVCALGACIMSKARLYDNVLMNKVFDTNSFDGSLSIGYSDINSIKDMLTSVFSNLQMGMIESAFEKCQTGTGNHRDDDWSDWSTKEQEQIDRAIKFGKKYRSDRKRLAAIMRNIVRNKGVFTP